ncbi:MULTISPECIES: hypothetical protein [Bacillales]|jgi:hypothetical protein|uniref:Uncharacterized protein n=2 Tax=Bacillus cereus group TaxID=86661 RepID=A0A9X8SDG8_9BACI|nr:MULTISPECIES: hypothetical protein [Bacillales]ACJ82892.1 hypothetical protein BCAH187_E0056 [Bacillus cereus AH187]MDX5778280.1 hypothetical protein [Bacillus cereus group sp. DSM 4312]SME03123.1 hypothetical protein BACERE00221_02164 [Bacillus paranthracis]
MEKNKSLQESSIKKGGLNDKPLTPRPPAPPAQPPKQNKNN